MSDDWTIESELCRLSSQPTMELALSELKLWSDGGVPEIRTDPKWERGGAETYIYRFSLGPEERELNYIIKACVTTNTALGVNGTVMEWVRRRALIASSGVKTPTLYYAGQGVILEELIPLDLREVLTKQPQKMKLIFPQLLQLVVALSGLGFLPVNVFSDLRSRGSDVVVVDFGQDLGSPGTEHDCTAALVDELKAKLTKWGLTLDARQLQELDALRGKGTDSTSRH